MYGIKFAAIQPDFAYLMYPARWFPVAGYSTDRFAADMRITVPDGYNVVGSGLDSRQSAGGKTTSSSSSTTLRSPAASRW